MDSSLQAKTSNIRRFESCSSGIPNVVAEWLTLLCIWEVQGSNLDLETSYPGWEYSWFSSVPPGNCQERTLNRATTTSTSFPIHNLLINLSFDVIYSWVTEKASLNKLQINILWFHINIKGKKLTPLFSCSAGWMSLIKTLSFTIVFMVWYLCTSISRWNYYVTSLLMLLLRDECIVI
jgi:hypothetical protein